MEGEEGEEEKKRRRRLSIRLSIPLIPVTLGRKREEKEKSYAPIDAAKLNPKTEDEISTVLQSAIVDVHRLPRL